MGDVQVPAGLEQDNLQAAFRQLLGSPRARRLRSRRRWRRTLIRVRASINHPPDNRLGPFTGLVKTNRAASYTSIPECRRLVVSHVGRGPGGRTANRGHVDAVPKTELTPALPLLSRSKLRSCVTPSPSTPAFDWWPLLALRLSGGVPLPSTDVAAALRDERRELTQFGYTRRVGVSTPSIRGCG